MDIHPPHGDITSVKQFLLYLLTITIGILIALSLEGLLEWRHHHALVIEARENLRREIEGNKKTIDDALQRAPEVRKNLEQTLGVIETALKHQKIGALN